MIAILLAMGGAHAQTECADVHTGPIVTVDLANPALDTVQEAVDAANDGDQIAIPAGMFQGSIDLMGKSLTLRGQGCDQTTLFGTNGPTLSNFGGRVTVHDLAIEAESAWRGAVINSSKVRFEGVCVQNLGSTLGSASVIPNGAGVLASDTNFCAAKSVFRANEAEDGGALHVINTSNEFVELIDSTFDGNVAENGGALYIQGGTVRLTGTSLTGNTATMFGGGGWVQEAVTLSVTSSTVSTNEAQLRGGGLWVEETPVSIVSSTFDTNSANLLYGGALHQQYEPADLSIQQSSFIDNHAITGGAIFWDSRAANPSSDVELLDSEFRDNGAEKTGGAITLARAANLTVDRSVFRDNDVSGGSGQLGGAMYTTLMGATDVRSTFFCGNEAIRGGAFFHHNATGPTQMVNNIFANNTARTNFGGALWAGGGEDLLLDANTWTGSSATNGASIYLNDVAAGSAVQSDSNLVVFDTASAAGGAAIHADAAAAGLMSTGWGNNACDYNTHADFSSTFSPAPTCHTGTQEPFADPSTTTCSSLTPNYFLVDGDFIGFGADPSSFLSP